MVLGTFYCNQIPLYALAKIEWLGEEPIRDWELEEEVGEEVWMVQYDADHPDMQKYNRYVTCEKWGFLGTTFEDDVELDDQLAVLPSW